jgi:hypothetical protein
MEERFSPMVSSSLAEYTAADKACTTFPATYADIFDLRYSNLESVVHRQVKESLCKRYVLAMNCNLPVVVCFYVVIDVRMRYLFFLDIRLSLGKWPIMRGNSDYVCAYLVTNRLNAENGFRSTE